MQSPRRPHLDAAIKVLCYLKGSPRSSRFLSANNSLYVSAYFDDDWASCPTTRCSTTGYCTFLGFGPLTWRSKKQHTVSRSPAKAKYRAMAQTSCELQWLSFLLRDLGVPHPLPTML